MAGPALAKNILLKRDVKTKVLPASITQLQGGGVQAKGDNEKERMSEGPRGTRPRETAEMTFNIPTRVPGGFGEYLKRPFPSCGNLTCEGKKKNICI